MISTDTRPLVPGDLFVALKGERFDAHDFLAEARARGATAAVVRRGTPAGAGLPFFEVDDTLAALGALARARRRALAGGEPGRRDHRVERQDEHQGDDPRGARARAAACTPPPPTSTT